MRRSTEFSRTVREGARAGRSTLVVHLRPRPGRPVIGFVVARSVGGTVKRNLVKRRLRSLTKDRLATLPAADIVVRALAPSAAATFADLSKDFDSVVRTAVQRATR